LGGNSLSLYGKAAEYAVDLAVVQQAAWQIGADVPFGMVVAGDTTSATAAEEGLSSALQFLYWLP